MSILTLEATTTMYIFGSAVFVAWSIVNLRYAKENGNMIEAYLVAITCFLFALDYAIVASYNLTQWSTIAIKYIPILEILTFEATVFYVRLVRFIVVILVTITLVINIMRGIQKRIE